MMEPTCKQEAPKEATGGWRFRIPGARDHLFICLRSESPCRDQTEYTAPAGTFLTQLALVYGD